MFVGEVNVENATSQLPRIVRLALIGAFTAFAWIVLSLAFGLSASNAHAAESDDDGVLEGALGTVTSLVDKTATAVTGTVSGATTGVTEVVNTVVAVAPAPVQQPVSGVVESVGTVVTAVTQPVSDIASSGVVSGVTAPVVDLVTEVPVVGDVVSGIGLDDAVTDLSETVDETLGGVVAAVDETGGAIGTPPAGGPLLPGLPDFGDGTGIPGYPGIDAGVTAAAAEPADAPTTATLRDTALRTTSVAASVAESLAEHGSGVSVALAGSAGAPGSAGGLGLPASASTGPGGAGPGAWALLALGPLAAHRAWVRRTGHEDEHAPPAPVGSTDVSPD